MSAPDHPARRGASYEQDAQQRVRIATCYARGVQALLAAAVGATLLGVPYVPP